MSLARTALTTLVLINSFSAFAGQSYTYPEHFDISEDNYGKYKFKAAPAIAYLRNKEEIKTGDVLYVGVRYTGMKTVDGEMKHVELLGRNDRVRVLDSSDAPEGYIRVKVLQSWKRFPAEYFVKHSNLTRNTSHNKDFDTDVFVVQNIATQKLRIYQRICKDYSCPPKMIVETDFVHGKNKEGKRTFVGSFRISKWSKFYQDRSTKAHYPSFYDPKYPPAPKRGANWEDWFDKEFMPVYDGEPVGDMRGAFGYYTALVTPNHGIDQWTHGTVGWGQDSEEAICVITKGKENSTCGDKYSRGLIAWFANKFADLGSSGCSRVSNPAIAFMRHLLPVGTPIIKIYAKETKQSPRSMRKYFGNRDATKTWDYILTADGVRKYGEGATSAHRQDVLARGVSPRDFLDQGTFEIRTTPTVSNNISYDRKNRKFEIIPENPYEVEKNEIQGVFYIDTGLLDGYVHPKSIGKGGFTNEKGKLYEAYPQYLEYKNYLK